HQRAVFISSPSRYRHEKKWRQRNDFVIVIVDENNTARERRVFNYRLSRARLVVENAFGILSSQWRMYHRLTEVQPDVVERCVKATCVLHNFMRRSAEAPAVRGAVQGAEDSLQSLGRVAANNSAREAIR
ncbi:hypothetical protein M9458_053761, partial [Cirrhinus mrigala]